MRLSLGAPLSLVAVAAALSLFGCGGGTEHADARDGAAGQDAGPADHARDVDVDVDGGAGPETAVVKDARDDGGPTGSDALGDGSAGQPDARADLPPAGDGAPAGDAGDGSAPPDARDATTGGDAA